MCGGVQGLWGRARACTALGLLLGMQLLEAAGCCCCCCFAGEVGACRLLACMHACGLLPRPSVHTHTQVRALQEHTTLSRRTRTRFWSSTSVMTTRRPYSSP